MRKTLLIIAAMGVVAFAAFLLAAGSKGDAAFPGANGKIAFATERDGNGEVYVMTPDGTGQTNMTMDPADDYTPVWSPDGSKIAFLSDREGDYDIYVMNADGSGLTRLTTSPAQDVGPAWSPDGAKIAFNTNRDGNFEIYVMNADGTSQTNLTNHPAFDRAPEWSPDGTKIAFHTDRDGNFEIFAMEPDGSSPQNLTNSPDAETFASWAPDGALLAFTSNRDGNPEIYVMNADGGRQTRLTDNPASENEAAFSPDGTKIAFDTSRDGDWEVYTMNIDGTDQTNVSNNPSDDFSPDWQPLGGLKGDMNCDGAIDSVDALFILRHVAHLLVSPPSGCPPINWPASHGPNPIVSSGTGGLDGTWQFDFDTGTQVSHGDVFWEITEYVGHTVGDIVPVGSARAVNLGMVDFDSLTYTGLWYLPFSMASIHGSDDAGSQLAPGDVFAVFTSNGNVAKVRVEAYAYTLQLQWVTYQGAPRGDVNCDGQVDSVDALFILRHLAGLTVTLPPGCPEIGM